MVATVRTIVGLDLSLTCTGWATWTDGTLTTGCIKPGTTRKGVARRRWIAEAVARLADTADVDPLLVIEAVPTRGARDIVALGELHGVVLDNLDGYRPGYVDAGTLKTYATGWNKAPKDVVTEAAAVVLGYTGTSHDEADAAWLATIGRHWAGETGPLFTPQRATLLANIAWPEGILL